MSRTIRATKWRNSQGWLLGAVAWPHGTSEKASATIGTAIKTNIIVIKIVLFINFGCHSPESGNPVCIDSGSKAGMTGGQLIIPQKQTKLLRGRGDRLCWRDIPQDHVVYGLNQNRFDGVTLRLVIALGRQNLFGENANLGVRELFIQKVDSRRRRFLNFVILFQDVFACNEFQKLPRRVLLLALTTHPFRPIVGKIDPSSVSGDLRRGRDGIIQKWGAVSERGFEI